MLRLMVMLMRVAATCAAVALLAACASSGGDDELEAADAVTADTAQRFRSEAQVHGAVESEQCCEVTTSGDMLSAEQSKQNKAGAPINGWLVESPRDTRVYRCTYDGQFPHNARRVAVWEAADADAGGPRPAVTFTGLLPRCCSA